jgi:hypothetical protein
VGDSYTVNGSVTFTAQWETAVPDGLSLAQALNWLSGNAAQGGAYTITLRNDETIFPETLFCGGKTVNITLTSGTTERTVSLGSNGSLFTVANGVTLTLGNNVTLSMEGELSNMSNNSAPLVRVETGGTLVMNSGSEISGNYIYSSGALVYGGGVYVNGGTFVMNGGAVSGNSISSSYACGGGVYVNSGSFMMTGGTISDNLVQTINANAAEGGGVYMKSGTFMMTGGTISGNSAYLAGGGVYVHSNATFTKTGQSTIYGSDESSSLKNTLTASGSLYGHAVYFGKNTTRYDTTLGPGVDL